MIALRRPQVSRRLVFSGRQHTIAKIICFIQCNIHIYNYHINKSDVASHISDHLPTVYWCLLFLILVRTILVLLYRRRLCV